MSFLRDLIFGAPCAARHKNEVHRLLNELLQIGKTDDFLSERPGQAFNMQSRHVRAREIGKRLDEIGGISLMEYAYRRVNKKLGATLGEHLDFAWREVGSWG